MDKLLFLILVVFCVGFVQAEPPQTSSYTTTQVTKQGEGYWNIGTEVALYLVAIPLLLIPVILIGFKFFQKNDHGDGHYEDHGHGWDKPGHKGGGHKRSFTVSYKFLNDLTEKVYKALKEFS